MPLPLLVPFLLLLPLLLPLPLPVPVPIPVRERGRNHGCVRVRGRVLVSVLLRICTGSTRVSSDVEFVCARVRRVQALRALGAVLVLVDFRRAGARGKDVAGEVYWGEG